MSNNGSLEILNQQFSFAAQGQPIQLSRALSNYPSLIEFPKKHQKLEATGRSLYAHIGNSVNTKPTYAHANGMILESPWYEYLFVSDHNPSVVSPYENKPTFLAIARLDLTICQINNFEHAAVDVTNIQGASLGKDNDLLDALTSIKWQVAMIHILRMIASNSSAQSGQRVFIALNPDVPRGEHWSSKIPSIAKQMGAIHQPKIEINNMLQERYFL